ncbi:hypothetical protein LTS18_002593, partial [Coniosporium uncinatum]
EVSGNDNSIAEVATSDPAYPQDRADTLDADDIDWFNVDAAFENMDALLGSSGADLSIELLRPFYLDPEGHGNGLLL